MALIYEEVVHKILLHLGGNMYTLGLFGLPLLVAFFVHGLCHFKHIMVLIYDVVHKILLHLGANMYTLELFRPCGRTCGKPLLPAFCCIRTSPF
jgi:hypothetical protein